MPVKVSQPDRLGNNQSIEAFPKQERLQRLRERKAQADQLQKIYRTSEEVHHRKYAERMFVCGRHLQLVPGTNGQGERDYRVHSLHCNVRFCPVCQAAKSERAAREFAPVVAKIQGEFSGYRWLFLTITIRNVPPNKVRNAFTEILNPGFNRLVKRKAWPAEGWTVAREVTRSKQRKDAHPHLHVLMLVPPQYFESSYLSKDDWIELVQDAFRLDYRPAIDVQAVKGRDELQHAVLETFKYAVKSQDLVTDRSFCLTVTDQMRGLRSRSNGGIFKKLLASMSDEDYPVDDVDEVDEVFKPDLDGEVIHLLWKRRLKRYERIERWWDQPVLPWGHFMRN